MHAVIIEHADMPHVLVVLVAHQTKQDSKVEKKLSKKEKADMIDAVTREMKKAAGELDFERAMELRDILFELQSE